MHIFKHNFYVEYISIFYLKKKEDIHSELVQICLRVAWWLEKVD